MLNDKGLTAGLMARLLAGTAPLAAIAVIAAPAAAQSASVEINIPAQPAQQALAQLAQQSGVQIIYDMDAMSGFQTKPVRGSMTVQGAAQKMLEGAPFDVVATEAGSLAIRPRHAGAASTGEAEAGSAAAVIESADIVVTAQKREQSIKDVPISISAVSGQELNRRGIANMSDLARSVPSLAVYEFGAGKQNIAIRGISTVQGSSALTGIYLDEIPISGVTGGETPAYLDLRTIDLERVEVLKGPQGTLFGEGAVGGVIHYITKDPQLGQLSGSVEATLYDTKDGDWSKETVGILNIPVVNDVFALRIAGTYEDKGGWIDKPSTGENDFNDSLVKNVRVKALLAPTEDLSVIGLFNIHRNRGGGSNIVNLKPYSRSEFRQAFDVNAPTRYRDDYEIYGLTIKYDLGFADLLSATSHWKSNNLFSYTQLIDANPVPSLEILVRDSRADGSITSQEFRLASNGKNAFKWLIGASYKDSKLSSWSDTGIQARLFSGDPDGVIDGLSAGVVNASESSSLAGFADGSYSLGNLEIGGGLRYYRDHRKTFDPADRVGTFQSATFNKWTYRAYARYALSKTSNLYVNVATGFRSGGFNSADNVVLGAPETYRPENTIFYEIGSKNTFFDGRVGFDFALFTGKYKDRLEGVIRVSPVDPSAVTEYIVNTGIAKIKGLEWLLSWRPVTGLQLGVSGDITDSKNSFVEDPVGGPVIVGDRLNYVPDHSLVISGNYSFHWAEDIAGFIDISFNQKGKATATFRNGLAADPIGRSPTVNFLQASLGTTWNGFQLVVFARNLLDERQPIAPSETGATPQARPRTLGLSLSKSF